MRISRRIAAEHDLAISPLDEFDFGRRGLQYVHFPWLPIAARHSPVLAEPRRRRPWARLADFSVQRVRSNSTVANSRYTARALREQLGIEAEVIYPPCPGDFPPRPWERRSDSVVMIGRLVAHKRFDLAVEVVRRVRAEAGDVRLVVIGNWRGVGHSDRVEVGRLLSSEPWIELREEVSRADLGAVVSESRYGIHPFEGEPYGIAVAEMVRAGCIPITRRSGGPPEITGEDERLRFDSAEEGAARLLALMRSEDDRNQIRAQLRRRAPTLAPEEFVRRIRDWVSSAAGAAG
jgi:glycosyltransferase involved in cell wall biosynthesis